MRYTNNYRNVVLKLSHFLVLFCNNEMDALSTFTLGMKKWFGFVDGRLNRLFGIAVERIDPVEEFKQHWGCRWISKPGNRPQYFYASSCDPVK